MKPLSDSQRSLQVPYALIVSLAALLGASAADSLQRSRPHLPVHPAASAASVLTARLRSRIHHVFVVYQENRSFDSYFGTFPGADNLAADEARTHGFRQYDSIGKTWVTPFAIDAPDTADPGHAREQLLAKSNDGHMDQFVAVEEESQLKRHASNTYAQQLGLLTMAHEDCRTIPFLWLYAHRFTLYDHIFQGMYGPSTPGNIDLIAGQTGQTQMARHPDQTKKPGSRDPGEPVLDDLDPAWGPYADGKPPVAQFDQTYATVLLTLLGRRAALAKVDADGVREDIDELTKLNAFAVPWAWYQEGFGDGGEGTHPAYITHHNAPQYFGYLRRNEPLWRGVHDLTDFFGVIAERKLPPKSVVFLKGGSHNPFGWRPADSSAAVQARFAGDDDHPGYSDSQISESFVAKAVNAVARSPYWRDSAIVIFWDDSGGFYDHVPPPQFEACPDQHPCGDGPRLPLILVSPYARAGGIVSDPGDHASFAKFLDRLFQLPPLASLPDEKPYLPEGPRDSNPALTDLTGGFDPERLAGKKPPIPPAEAEIRDQVVDHFPAAMTCSSIGVTPVELPGSSPPAGFNPLPSRGGH